MRCARCGTELNSGFILPDGILQCPACGARYRRKDPSGQADPSGSDRKRRNRKPGRLPKVLLIGLAAAVALFFLSGRIYSLMNRPDAQEGSITPEQDDNFLIPSVDPDHIIEDGPVRYASNELILCAAKDTDYTDIAEFIGNQGWTLAGYDKILGFYLARLPYDYTAEEDFERCRSMVLNSPLFEDAYLNYVFQSDNNVTSEELYRATVSNDAEYLPLGNNTDRYWGQTAIRLPQAYARLAGRELATVSVGVIDNQFYDHDDIRATYHLYITPTYNPDIDKPEHGTHVAGIIGSIRDNNLGIGGVNDRIRLSCYQVHGFDASGAEKDEAVNTFTWLTILSRLMFNADCKVVNLSMGIKTSSYKGNVKEDGTPMTSVDDLREEMDRILKPQMYYVRNVLHRLLREHDFLLVVSAGNDNDLDGYLGEAKYISPFTYIEDEEIKSHIIVVGNLARNSETEEMFIWDSSNYGERVDILAPGTNICSAVPKKKWLESIWLGEDCFEIGYNYMTGTSMAAPYVTGVASLIWSINPDFTSEQVRSFLLGGPLREFTYRPGKSYSRDEWHRLLNAENAIQTALEELEKTEQAVPAADWQEAYREFIMSRRYLSMGQDFYEGTALTMRDMDRNGIPEILIWNGADPWLYEDMNNPPRGEVYVYTYKDGEVQRVGAFSGDGMFATDCIEVTKEMPGILYVQFLDGAEEWYYVSLKDGNIITDFVSSADLLGETGSGYDSKYMSWYTVKEIDRIGWPLFLEAPFELSVIGMSYTADETYAPGEPVTVTVTVGEGRPPYTIDIYWYELYTDGSLSPELMHDSYETSDPVTVRQFVPGDYSGNQIGVEVYARDVFGTPNDYGEITMLEIPRRK